MFSLIGKWLARDKIVHRATGPRGVYIVRRISSVFYVYRLEGVTEFYEGSSLRFNPARNAANIKAR